MRETLATQKIEQRWQGEVERRENELRRQCESKVAALGRGEVDRERGEVDREVLAARQRADEAVAEARQRVEEQVSEARRQSRADATRTYIGERLASELKMFASHALPSQTGAQQTHRVRHKNRSNLHGRMLSLQCNV